MPTRDRPGRLDALLESLTRQTLPAGRFEVVVVDDGSGPATSAVLDAHERASSLQVRRIRFDAPRGPAAARNASWRAARGPLVAFTDDDCVADPDWLRAGLRAAERNPGAIIQGRIDPIPAEAERLTPFSHLVFSHGCGPWFGAGNMFYPRAVLDEVGGFDEVSYPRMGGADTDLAWRAIEAGARAIAADDARVFHAVMQVGPLGRLRRASRWSDAVKVFRRHPELRKQMPMRIFWNERHLELTWALVAATLPRRLWPLRLWLAAPYVVYLTKRRSGPLLAPYLVLHDLVEVAAVVRGAVRARTLMI